MTEREPSPSIHNAHTENLSSNPKRHCIFISGMGGFHDGLSGIRKGLKEAYGGEENITVFNSIFSPDQPNPHRFEQIANSIAYHLEKENGQLDIIVHSLGAAELYNALKVLKRSDKNYFKNAERNKNLHIILVGPSGSSANYTEKTRYLKNVIRMARKEMTNTPLGTKSHTLERGILSLTQFPAKNIPDIAEKTRKVLPEFWSNRHDGISDIPFKAERDNNEYLSDDQRELTALDAKLNDTTSNEEIRDFIRQRGEIVRSSIEPLWSAAHEPGTTPSTEPLKPHIRAKGLFKTIFRGLGNEPIKKFQELAKKGIRISWLVPEYDIVPIKRVLRFYDKLDDKKAADHMQVPKYYGPITVPHLNQRPSRKPYFLGALHPPTEGVIFSCNSIHFKIK
jgi:hypothetical protein